MKKKTWEYIITMLGIMIGIIDILLINGAAPPSNAVLAEPEPVSEVELLVDVETDELVADLSIETPEWVWPVAKKYYITSRFGPRWGKNHNAIDIAATGYQPPIMAVKDGTIVLNTYGSGYGYYIVIDHHNGYLTLYAHFAKKSSLAVGTEVKQSEVVGYMGCTGNCTGQHLHLGVLKGESYKNSKYVNPCTSIFEC